MNLLSIENLSKSYSEKILLKDIALGIEEGDKIGIIGVNGTGKSTLLKIIAGLEVADTGTITKVNGLTLEYLAQNTYFDEKATVLEQVFKGSSPVMKLIREYEKALDLLHVEPENKSYQQNILQLQSQMDALNGWQVEQEAKTILTKLGISNFDMVVGTLSGGQRKRIALASALINPTDLLILDEPTNHIDSETVEWLEQYLNKRKGALLMITHDRYFLDRVANKMIELDRGNLYTYVGNYSKFLELKIEREELEQGAERKKQNLFRKELEWMKKGAKARTTKQKARIGRFEKLEQETGNLLEEKLEISVGSSRLGRKVIELKDICKSYPQNKLIENFNCIVTREDRIGIVGINGRGKSTLVDMITGKVQPDSGVIDIGTTVKIGYFSQENKEMDENLRVIEYIKEEAEFITVSDGTKISASQMLERFLFSSTLQWTPIAKLSGGERRRLYLLRVLMSEPNVLVLDEPTNDLDIQTLTILEGYIDEFPGAVITVSHDRYFLDRTVERILAFEGQGKIVNYTGNYSHYQEFIKEKEKENMLQEQRGEQEKKAQVEKKKEKPLKFTYKEQKEYDEIDDVIAVQEEKIEQIGKAMELCGSDYEKLQKLMAEKEALEADLDNLMERWTYLNELAEKIENP